MIARLWLLSRVDRMAIMDSNAPRSAFESDMRSTAADSRFLNSNAWNLRWSDRAESRSYARRALELAQNEATPNDAAIGQACRTLAWQDRWCGEFDSALTLARRAEGRLDPKTHPLSLAEAILVSGIVHYARGRGDLAAKAIERASVFAKTRPNTPTSIDILAAKATVLRASGRIFEAYETLQEARTLSQTVERARIDHIFARFLEMDDNVPRAVSFAMRATIGARRHGNRVVLPYALEILGSVLAQSGHYTLALGYLDEGLGIAKEDRDRRVQCQITARIGHLAQMMGDDKRALQTFHNGLDLCKRLDYAVWQIKFLRHIAKLHQRRNEDGDAVAAYAELVDVMEATRR